MQDERASGVLKWGCSDCKGVDYADGDELQKDRNCSGTGPPIYLSFLPGQNSCPWSSITEEAVTLVNFWMDFDRWRVLPFGGSDLMNYPAYIFEAFSICEAERTQVKNESIERENQARKAEERKAKMESRGRRGGL